MFNSPRSKRYLEMTSSIAVTYFCLHLSTDMESTQEKVTINLSKINMINFEAITLAVLGTAVNVGYLV